MSLKLEENSAADLGCAVLKNPAFIFLGLEKGSLIYS